MLKSVLFHQLVYRASSRSLHACCRVPSLLVVDTRRHLLPISGTVNSKNFQWRSSQQRTKNTYYGFASSKPKPTSRFAKFYYVLIVGGFAILVGTPLLVHYTCSFTAILSLHRAICYEYLISLHLLHITFNKLLLKQFIMRLRCCC